MRSETSGSEGKQRTPSQMKREEESCKKKLEPSDFTLRKRTGRPRPDCLGHRTPQNEAVCLRLLCFSGWGIAAARLGRDFLRLGNSWWVGMPQCLAVKECSLLSINLAFQQSWRLAVQNYSLVLLDALLSSSRLLRGRAPTRKLLGRYQNSTTSMGTEWHIHFIFKRYPLEKN